MCFFGTEKLQDQVGQKSLVTRNYYSPASVCVPEIGFRSYQQPFHPPSHHTRPSTVNVLVAMLMLILQVIEIIRKDNPQTYASIALLILTIIRETKSRGEQRLPSLHCPVNTQQDIVIMLFGSWKYYLRIILLKSIALHLNYANIQSIKSDSLFASLCVSQLHPLSQRPLIVYFINYSKLYLRQSMYCSVKCDLGSWKTAWPLF